MPILSRRLFVAGAFALAVASGRVSVSAVTPVIAWLLGSKRADVIRKLEADRSYARENVSERMEAFYSTDGSSSPHVFARFDLNDNLEFIEYDGSASADGFPEPENPNWRSSTIPKDAVTRTRCSTIVINPEMDVLDLEFFSSEWIASATDRSGNGLYAFMSSPEWLADPKLPRRLFATMESHEPFSVETGSPSAGILDDKDTWDATYGRGGAAQHGWTYTLDSGLGLLKTREDAGTPIISLARQGVPINTVASAISLLLPADAELVSTHLLYPTPTGPNAMRVQRWHAAQPGVDIVVVIVYSGYEADGKVRHFIMQVGQTPE